MRRLLPTPSCDLDVTTAYPGPLGAHADRPWVSLCMVTSIDGSTVVDGRSGGLSSETDGAVLGRLRAIADVIVVGSGTARGEGYGPPKKPGQRIGVVTGSGSVDVTTELFTSGAGFVITSETTPVDEGAVDVVRAGRDDVDLAAAFGLLDAVVPGVRHVHAEGGATLNGALAAADLLDELDITTSPLVVGGEGPRLVATSTDLEHRFELEQLAVDEDGFLFSRWSRRR